MLTHLYIQNYALIRELDIQFTDGFSVITGETGAGKSIILGALGLITGNKADSKSIREGAQKCVIEVEYTGADRQWLADHDLDDTNNGELLIRREINANGKSRAFINDTPVTLSLLKELGNQLIDIHSQHENLLLQDDAFQLALVDALADNATIRAQYADAYHTYRTTQKQLQALQDHAARVTQEADYIAFQVKQLQEARVQQGEEIQLEAEYNLLTHAEEVRTHLNLATGYLSDDNQALSAVREAFQNLRKIETFLPANDALTERLNSLYIELKDINDTVETLAEQTEYDPTRLLQVEERLNLINSLLQKHHLHTSEELVALQADLEQQLAQIESFDEQVAILTQQLKADQATMLKLAQALTLSRKKVFSLIQERLICELTQLGIAHANIQLAWEQLAECTPSGQDNIQLLFSANKNGTLRNVAEVASGGEIARLMLCIKALLAHKQALPTLIFDEIDTGVSGDIASRMGQIMQQMGSQMQVISITHLPQIAALGSNHYKVYKADGEEFTETHINHLSPDERIQEIAQMLSGSQITPEAIANAKRLLHL